MSSRSSILSTSTKLLLACILALVPSQALAFQQPGQRPGNPPPFVAPENTVYAPVPAGADYRPGAAPSTTLDAAAAPAASGAAAGSANGSSRDATPSRQSANGDEDEIQRSQTEAEENRPPIADVDPSLISECEKAEKRAKAACATLSLLGMDSGSAAMVEMMLMQSAQTIIAMKTQGSAEQCKSGQDLNRMMGAITMAKTAACGAMMSKCNSRCRDAKETYRGQAIAAAKGELPSQPKNQDGSLIPDPNLEKEIITHYRSPSYRAGDKCDDYKGNFQAMLMQSMMQGQSMLAGQKCQSQLSTTQATPAFTTPTPLPTIGVTNFDCSSPQGQTQISCICQKDPSNTMCKTNGAGSVFGTGGSTVGGGPGTPTGGVGSMGDLGSDGEIVENAPAGKGTNGSQTSGDGGGGGLGGGSGGGGGSGFGDDGGGGGPSGINKDVITGQSGGGSGGSGSMGYAATSGGGGGGGRGGGDAGGGGGGGFNLSKFLPGQYKGRGIAGMSIEAKDGVTGPMGPSIWEKVTNQYQNQKSTMYQDR